jgi:putative oxygen-independent coproporphyrinogen III oxidase
VALLAPPLALYVHIPWCVRKCPYCDFNSHVAPQALPQRQYIDALLADLELDLPRVSGRELVSIFIGGGTPSLFDPGSIEGLLAAVRQRLTCSDDLEVTLEANPGTIERGRFEEYRAAGITRVSLGAQSFNPGHLRRLGRIHDSGEIFAAVAELRRAGIDNFNLDLMYALPEQSVPQAVTDLRAAVALGPSHISHYQLTLEPGTVFHHRPPQALPDDDAAWDMQVECQQLLAQAGYAQYEVSAYCRAGRQCRHNLNYWEFGDYLGVGAGAHGKLTEPDGITRTVRLRQPREYLQRAPEARTELQRLEPAVLPFEYMLNALRLVRGFSVRDFENRTGLRRAVIEKPLATALARGLIVPVEEGHFRPSELGMRFLNDLQALFLV